MDATRPLESPSDEADVAALVVQARAGDHAAAWELLQRYRPLLAQVIRRSRLAHQRYLRLFDREDLWQEAGYAFLLALQRYDASRQIPFGGYVKSLLPWHFHALQRHLEHDIAVGLDEGHLVQADPTSDFVIGIVIRELLTHLSPQQTRVLEAMYFADMSAAEIARHLGVTPRAVERTRRRAEAALLALLTQDDSTHVRLINY